MPARRAREAQSSGANLRGGKGFTGLGEEALIVVVGGTGPGVGDHDTKLGIDRPVNKEAEPLISKLFEAVWFVAGLLGERRKGCEEAR